jgi:hypothetical protein
MTAIFCAGSAADIAAQCHKCATFPSLYVIGSPMQQRVEEYTADAICRAVNLSGFMEPAWLELEDPTLRFVFTPSFHPEVCITISVTDRGALLSAIVFAERFWAIGPSAGLIVSREEISVSAEDFASWLKLFSTAKAFLETRRDGVFLDGMSAECCMVSRHFSHRFKTHVYSLPDQSFFGGILDVAWKNCKNPKVRNGLSDVASYLGLHFRREEVPDDPPISQIAVLGTPEARKEYFEMLQEVKGKKSKQ